MTTRRGVLWSVAALVTWVAGCSSTGTGERPSPSNGDGSPTDPTETGTRTVDPSAFPMYESPDRRLAIGSRASVDDPEATLPHDLLVWNAAAVPRSIPVRVRQRTAGTETTVLTDTDRIPSDGLLRVRLLEPATYRVSVESPKDGTSRTFKIVPDRFDCNESQTQVTVHPDGRITAESYTTDVGCRTETQTT